MENGCAAKYGKGVADCLRQAANWLHEKAGLLNTGKVVRVRDGRDERKELCEGPDPSGPQHGSLDLGLRTRYANPKIRSLGRVVLLRKGFLAFFQALQCLFPIFPTEKFELLIAVEDGCEQELLDLIA